MDVCVCVCVCVVDTYAGIRISCVARGQWRDRVCSSASDATNLAASFLLSVEYILYAYYCLRVQPAAIGLPSVAWVDQISNVKVPRSQLTPYRTYIHTSMRDTPLYIHPDFFGGCQLTNASGPSRSHTTHTHNTTYVAL